MGFFWLPLSTTDPYQANKLFYDILLGVSREHQFWLDSILPGTLKV